MHMRLIVHEISGHPPLPSPLPPTINSAQFPLPSSPTSQKCPSKKGGSGSPPFVGGDGHGLSNPMSIPLLRYICLLLFSEYLFARTHPNPPVPPPLKSNPNPIQFPFGVHNLLIILLPCPHVPLPTRSICTLQDCCSPFPSCYTNLS
jgi:hypothetical protein